MFHPPAFPRFARCPFPKCYVRICILLHAETVHLKRQINEMNQSMPEPLSDRSMTCHGVTSVKKDFNLLGQTNLHPDSSPPLDTKPPGLFESTLA